MTELLQVEDLSRTFTVRTAAGRQSLRAVDGVSFTVRTGQTVGLVGESGCGKSTTGLAALRLIEPTSGSIRFDSMDLRALGRSELRTLRSRMQIVLQDPRAQLNPRMRVAALIEEPLRAHGRNDRPDRVREVADLVGLDPSLLQRYAHELSGGQRQRVAIARAIAPGPDLLVCDEAVSALDVSVQTQVLNLLQDLQEQLGVSYLFISHSLAAVRYLADRVVVMYLGRVVEDAPADDFFARPAHPYSEALLSAVPSTDVAAGRERIVLAGDLPSPFAPPSGCAFHTRCPLAQPICTTDRPAITPVGSGRHVACHFPLVR